MKRTTMLLGFALLCVVAASAGTQVILGNSTTGDVQAVNTGPDSASVSNTGMCGSSSDCLSGLGYYGINVGTYTTWITGGTMSLGSSGGGVYAINMNGATIHFAFDFGANFLNGNMTLNNVTDGTNVPRFIGGLYITGSSLAGYPAGNYVPLDFNVYLGNNPTIDQVYAGSAPSTQGILSSGQIIPIPEPVSLATLGSGLIGMAGLLGRRLFA
jgi:hypothetical protein